MLCILSGSCYAQLIRSIGVLLYFALIVFDICVNHCLNISDGRVVRASASGAVDSSLIPIWVKPMTLKLVFTSSLLDALDLRDSVEEKQASLLVALSGIPSSWCGRQMAGNF